MEFGNLNVKSHMIKYMDFFVIWKVYKIVNTII